MKFMGQFNPQFFGVRTISDQVPLRVLTINRFFLQLADHDHDSYHPLKFHFGAN